MERRPLSEEYRLYAACSYIFPVSLFLLLHPKLREVRLIRTHAIQALLLFLFTILSLLVTSLLFALLGPFAGIGFLLFGGLVMLLLLLLASLLTGISVMAAYQGQLPSLPVLARIVKQVDRKIKRNFGIT